MISRTLSSIAVEGRASVWRDGAARMSPFSQLLYWIALVCSQELFCCILSTPLCMAISLRGKKPLEWAASAHKSLCLHTIQAPPFLQAESGCGEMDESHFPSLSDRFISGKQMCFMWRMHLGDGVPGVRSLYVYSPSHLFTALLIICSVSMGSGSLVKGNLPSWDLVQWLHQPQGTKPNLHAWVQGLRHSKKFW